MAVAAELRRPDADEVVIATRAAAVGPSDLTGPFDRVIGGEFSGDVIDVGTDVDPDLLHAPVAVLGPQPCGRCERCLAGLTTLCKESKTRGQTINGGLAEAVLVSANEVLPLPDGLGHEQATLMHRLARALRATRRSGARPGDTTAVVGSTPLGLAAATVVLAAGSGKTALIDDHQSCRSALTDAGALTLAAPSDAASWDTLKGDLDGYGPDVVFECAGTPQSRLAAIELARPAGTVVMVANDATPVTMDINLLVMGDKQVRGSRGYTVAEARTTLELMARSRIDVSKLIGTTLDIGDFLAAAADGSLDTLVAGCQATVVRWQPDAAVLR
jgi:threonine dehydrogenase-like Zn-dependent dehydrogenase